jgi:hypothetical protein
MRSEVKVLACVVLLISTNTLLARSHKGQYLLNLPGITAIAYRSYFYNELLSRRCEIDRYAWDESIRAVITQSTKLRFIPSDEYEAHLDMLRATVDGLAISSTISDHATKGLNEAQQELADYSSVPKLVLSVTSIGNRNGCVGWVKAVLELNHVIPARRIWYSMRGFEYPSRATKKMPWYNARVLSYANENYTEGVFRVAEGAIKSLVDDWTEAQTIPTDDMIP